jgi:small subunit ribosomal protein S16
MALKIRMSRGGSKKKPFYKIVVAEATSPRDGRFVEKVGTYNPFLSHENSSRVVLNDERVRYWLSVGAKPTDRVSLFLGKANIIEKVEQSVTTKKCLPKKKAQERLKQELAKQAS